MRKSAAGATGEQVQSYSIANPSPAGSRSNVETLGWTAAVSGGRQ